MGAGIQIQDSQVEIRQLFKYGDVISTNLVNVEGIWGTPFWGATVLFLGVYSTMMLNVSEYSRELRQEVRLFRQVAIYANSILPATLFMGLIGLMVTSATGEVDPISVFSSAVDNKPLLVITMIFIAFAQVTTNILNNVVPPAYATVRIFISSAAIYTIFLLTCTLDRTTYERKLSLKII